MLEFSLFTQVLCLHKKQSWAELRWKNPCLLQGQLTQVWIVSVYIPIAHKTLL